MLKASFFRLRNRIGRLIEQEIDKECHILDKFEIKKP